MSGLSLARAHLSAPDLPQKELAPDLPHLSNGRSPPKRTRPGSPPSTNGERENRAAFGQRFQNTNQRGPRVSRHGPNLCVATHIDKKQLSWPFESVGKLEFNCKALCCIAEEGRVRRVAG